MGSGKRVWAFVARDVPAGLTVVGSPAVTIARATVRSEAPRELEACRLIALPKVHDVRGDLTFVDGHRHPPFSIARVHYLYEVPRGESRVVTHTRSGSSPILQ